jgi:hypothetical protein
MLRVTFACQKAASGQHGPDDQNECENRASRNSLSFAVTLNWGMGSSSLNADVNALERLQIVRGRNSSYLGPKYRSWTVRALTRWRNRRRLRR